MQTYFVRLIKAMEQTKSWSALWEIRDTAISALEGPTLQHWIVKRVVTAAIELGDLDSAQKYASHRCIPQNDKTWLSLFAELSFMSGNIPKAIEFLNILELISSFIGIRSHFVVQLYSLGVNHRL